MENLDKNTTQEEIVASFEYTGYFLTSFQPILIYFIILIIFQYIEKYFKPFAKLMSEIPYTTEQFSNAFIIIEILLGFFCLYKCISYIATEIKLSNSEVQMKNYLWPKKNVILDDDQFERYLNYKFLFFKLRHSLCFTKKSNNLFKYEINLPVPKGTTCLQVIDEVKNNYKVLS